MNLAQQLSTVLGVSTRGSDIATITASQRIKSSHDIFAALEQQVNNPQSGAIDCHIPEALQRDPTAFLNQKIFNSITSETEMMRYMHRLQSKDLSLL